MSVETPNKNRANGASNSTGKKKYRQATISSFFKKVEKPATSSKEEDVKTAPTQLKIKEIKESEGAGEKGQKVSNLFVRESSQDSSPLSKARQHDENGKMDTTISARGRKRNTVDFAESSDEEGDISVTSVSKKRRRNRVEVSDDEDEYIPKNDEKESEQEEEEDSIAGQGLLSDEDVDEILELASKRGKPMVQVSTAKIAASPRTASSKRVPISPKATPSKSQGKHSKFNKSNEERYQWLVNEKDAEGRDASDPDYDPRTLYIPREAWTKFTPFEKQYWEIKSKMWDCIVFFKKGKFFELYEKDAHLANHLFDLKIAGGGRANMQLAGVPEMSFDYWASQFIQYGYKVAKVDQRESMLAREIREGSGKGIVERELQCVLTSGTLTDSGMLKSDLATYCLAIREEPVSFYEEEPSQISRVGKIFGVSIIDTATGHISLIEFEDDEECSQLDTLVSQVKPAEIIMEKSNICQLAHKIIKFSAQPDALFNYRNQKEFYDLEKTFDELLSQDYFESMEHWPKVLKRYYETGKKVAFHAFGGLLSYLQWLKLDKSLITMGQVEEYNTTDSQNCLTLDGVTLQNLEIFANTFDGSEKGTLFNLVNKAVTPMGKRQLRKWVMHPLLKIEDINERFDSVDLLLTNMNLRDVLETRLSKLPDLERMLSRVHSCTLKIQLFDKVLEGFQDIVNITEELSKFEDLDGSLKRYLSIIPKELQNVVESWNHAFDRRLAAEEGKIVPSRNVEPEFDQSLDRINSIEEELQNILREYKKQFKCTSIQYKDSGKEIYTIEIPTSVAKNVPHDWMQMGANKASKRYYSPEVQRLARDMAEALELHKALEEDLKSRLYRRFNTHYNSIWLPAIQSISSIDCILSLARTSESLGFPACRPKFVDLIDEKTGDRLNGYVNFKDLRHPCFNMGSSTAREFIPNDVELGNGTAQIGLLTGANAAGKSTVLRMTCIAVILSQLGCYVPSEQAELTPIDRIMTRLGASDNIMQGKSTFFVELSETKKILDLATNRSLLVVDELGRGGSSSDGFAIAEAVLHHVATHIQSLGFFATHYATLGGSFKNNPMVKPLKMAILVDEESRNVTFLYKLVDGRSEGSFGMHVASMCGIPREVVDNAKLAADNLEHTARLIQERKRLHQENDMVPLGLQSDFVRLVYGDGLKNSLHGTGENVKIYNNSIKANVLRCITSVIEGLNL